MKIQQWQRYTALFMQPLFSPSSSTNWKCIDTIKFLYNRRALWFIQVEFEVLRFKIRKLYQYRAEPVDMAYLLFPPPDVIFLLGGSSHKRSQAVKHLGHSSLSFLF